MGAILGEPVGEGRRQARGQEIGVEADLGALDQPVKGRPQAHLVLMLLDRGRLHRGPGQLLDITQPKAAWAILVRLEA